MDCLLWTVFIASSVLNGSCEHVYLKDVAIKTIEMCKVFGILETSARQNRDNKSRSVSSAPCTKAKQPCLLFHRFRTVFFIFDKNILKLLLTFAMKWDVV